MITEKLIQLEDLSKFLAIVDNYVITSITDTRGIITDVSKAFCDISGFSKDELIGKPHNIVRHDDTPPEIFKQMWDTVRSGKMWQGEMKNRKKNGGIYWVISTIFPRFDSQNTIIGFISLRQDITASKLLLKRERLLKVQSKNAAMGEMISMITHQWKQPLSTISAISNKIILKKGLGNLNQDDLESDMHKIQEYVEHLSETANAFQNFFKPKDTKQLIMLSDVLSYSIQLIGPALIENNIDLYYQCQNQTPTKLKQEEPFHCTIDNHDIELEISKNDLTQVMLNLIRNAIDAFTENKTMNPMIEIRVEKEHEAIQITVEDNGGGINSSILEGIFSPYRTSKGDEGTGLGLYMCKVIIEEQLGGNIRAWNTEKGAAFQITLHSQQG